MIFSYFKGLLQPHFLTKFSTPVVLFWGYLYYIVLGWALLSLPISQELPVSSLDNLFISTSAVSTTGLSPIDLSKNYSFIGEFIILLLVQFGGIGYMTFGSFVTIALLKKISPVFQDVCRKNFSLPINTKGNISTVRFLKIVIMFTLLTEALGAAILYAVFEYNNEKDALWSAVFHSVSAFSTAGFSLYSTGLEKYYNNVYLNFTINAVSLAGAIGFIVVADIWYMIKGAGHLHFTSKVILKITLWFIIIGTFLIYFLEPTVQHYSNWERLLISSFQVIAASTTSGFSTIPLGTVSITCLMILYFFMLFGASPSGTGGGLKTTTFATLLAVVRSNLKERDGVRFEKRTIPVQTITYAITNTLVYLLILFIAVMILVSSEKASFEALIFESISAMSTVGLSTGITSQLSEFGKFIIIVLMFVGRLGMVTFGIVIAAQDETREEEQDDTLSL